MMDEQRVLSFSVESADEGERLDKVICAFAPELSRSFVQKVFDDGGVTVNGKPRKKSYTVAQGEEVLVLAPVPVKISSPNHMRLPGALSVMR